ncbi:hypothetical protein GT347_17975 [Xylophilus rhododendri]|uniref:Uncharacterized protein n=1 Tax=Xylophilus rhododendri TaxID=2697032 RepID=A0A857JAD0_9BURK|nr:hypothetical protein [Xylophilus rhododendri]QHI99698.1 hypothetical protein GT347_17975 [Xylophilus rhododendri]
MDQIHAHGNSSPAPAPWPAAQQPAPGGQEAAQEPDGLLPWPLPFELMQLPVLTQHACVLPSWPVVPACGFLHLLECRYLQGQEPNAGIIERFNRGKVDAEQVLKVTSACIRQYGADTDKAIACLEGLARCRRFDTLAGRWHSVSPDAICYYLAMASCDRARKPWKLLALFDHLQTCGAFFPTPVFPNTQHYNTALSACERSGRPAEALILFDRLLQHGPLLPEPALPDIGTYSTVFSALDRLERQERYPELLRQGIEAGVFRPSLGLDSERGQLDLHRHALLVDAGVDGQRAVHPAIARGLFLALASDTDALGARRIGEHTEFLLSELGTGAVKLAIVQCMQERGWHPVYRRNPPGHEGKGYLGIGSVARSELNPLAQAWEQPAPRDA